MTLLLTVLSGLLVAPVIAGLLASALCSRSILREEEPPWSHALVAAIVAICGSLWLTFRGDAFHVSRWPSTFPGHWDAYMIALAPSFPLTVLVVLVAVALFRQRFKKHLPRRLWIRQRRRKALHRHRWWRLIASSALVIFFTVLLVYTTPVPVSSRQTFVAPNFSADPYRSSKEGHVPAQPAEVRMRPLLDFLPDALVPWPVCVVGLALSGGWLAFTITYWRGYLQVRPRHRRDLLARHQLPAEGFHSVRHE